MKLTDVIDIVIENLIDYKEDSICIGAAQERIIDAVKEYAKELVYEALKNQEDKNEGKN